MSNNKTYWLGEKIGSRRVGRVRIGNAMYGIGDEIPIGDVSPEKKKLWGTSGAIGGMMPVAVAAKPVSGKIKELEDACATAVSRIVVLEELLTTERRTISELGEAVSNRDATISGLETEITRLGRVVIEGKEIVEGLDIREREALALEAYNNLKAKVLKLDSEAKAVLALKEEVSDNDETKS